MSIELNQKTLKIRVGKFIKFSKSVSVLAYKLTYMKLYTSWGLLLNHNLQETQKKHPVLNMCV